MPRNLARLRFKAPKAVVPVPAARDAARLLNTPRPLLENQVKQHVLSRSKPSTALTLRYVVDPRWKKLPGMKGRKLAHKPHTLRDLVDPQAKMQHGQVIYIFKNIRTNQVIYSLAELLDNFHLQQLPFIGKHSKPATLRPDDWTPHCVVIFPSVAQGMQAFRKLREYRKLHETAWDKTNPEWIKLPIRKRMKKIMDQVGFATADIAQILVRQEQQKKWQIESLEQQRQQVSEYLNKKWPEIEALSKASLVENKRDGDNTQWLEHQIKDMDRQLALKTNQNDQDQKRLKTAKRSHEVRLKKILYARRKYAALKASEQKLEAAAALAKQPGATDSLASLQDKVAQLGEQLGQMVEQRSSEEIASEQQSLRESKRELLKLKRAFEAKRQLETWDHPVARSIVPEQLRKQLPQPFSMEVEIKWADLVDAELARDVWPAGVVHDILPLRAQRDSVQWLTPNEYEAAVDTEVIKITHALQRQAYDALYPPEPEPAEVETKATGISRYLPALRNPFKRAET